MLVYPSAMQTRFVHALGNLQIMGEMIRAALGNSDPDVVKSFLSVAKKWFKGFYTTLGPIRFHVMTFLLLCMAALPIKMVLRWLFNLKYIVGIPEYFFNI